VGYHFDFEDVLFINRYVFLNFIYFDLEFSKGDHNSLLPNTKILLIPPFSSEDGLYRILSSYLLAHLMKKSARVLRKSSSEPVWETTNGPLLYFWDRFVENKRRFEAQIRDHYKKF
jgi:hypothetical protein